MRKTIFCIFIFLIVISTVSATSISIDFIPENAEFSAGEPITFKISLKDDSGELIKDNLNVIIEDSENKIERINSQSNSITTKEFSEASAGQGTITASYQGLEAFGFFYISEKEKIDFSVDGNILIVTNNGNTIYGRKITITIGETEGIKEPNLEPGESVKYRLIAPDGNYNLKVTDGKNTLTRSSVQLAGTGNVIGAIDESISQRTGITGGVSPDAESDVAILSYIKRNTFIYVFVAVIFGAMILIGFERHYRNKG